MNEDPERKLDQWINEEIAALQAKGATTADLKEDACARLLTKKLTEKHAEEIEADAGLKWFLAKTGFESLSPDECRQIAAILRRKGKLDLAYDFECLADERERGF